MNVVIAYGLVAISLADTWFAVFFRGGWNLTGRTYSGDRTVGVFGQIKTLLMCVLVMAVKKNITTVSAG